MEHTLGIDVGATKIALGIVSEGGDVLASTEVSSRAADGEELWTRVEAAGRLLLQESGVPVQGIGIGSAGPIDAPAGTVSPVNIAAWRDFPLVPRLREAFNMKNVRMCGDAMALAHAEARFGAGRGSTGVFGLVVSTGIGGGVVLNGELYVGESVNAAFFGHMTVFADGVECVCGRHGCVEAYASGPSMVRHAKSHGWASDETEFPALADAARAGDPAALAAISEGARVLAIAIVNVLVIVDVKTVVIGGGVSRAGDIYWKPFREHFDRERAHTAFLADVRVLPAELGAHAGIVGGALAAM